MFEKIFKGNGEIHDASNQARKWLSDNGYIYGATERNEPIAVMKGEGPLLPKWRNIPDDLKVKLDGKLHVTMSDDALLILNEEPQV